MCSKPTYHRYLLFLLLPLLMGCNLRKLYATPVPTINTPTQSILTLTVTPQPTKIDSVETPTPTFTPTSTPFQSVTLAGLRVAYMIDGNIYSQDSGGQPIQLTDSGEDRWPMFTDDGQKIVFFRGSTEQQRRLYVMDADGSHQQPLITGSILVSLGLGYDELSEVNRLVFVPGTHKILFSTQEFSLTGRNSDHPVHHTNQDLLLLDIDTTQFIKFQDPADGLFQVSPDGKLVADSSNVFQITGEIVHRNLMTNLPKSQSWVQWTDPFWTQDSRKVIVLPPINRDAEPMSGPQERTIWQYPVDGSAAVEIRLNPAPVNASSISPDGNWIIYDYFYYPGYTDEKITAGLYLGNLRTATSQLIGSSYIAPFPLKWSADSEHFFFEDANDHLYIGNTQGDVNALGYGTFMRWIDNNHYLYENHNIWMCTIGEQACVSVVALPRDRIKYIRNYDYFASVFVQPTP